jgi:prolycopene isomerase
MYDSVIIGAGIGGLVCGGLLAKAGKRVCIIEKHTKPGGYMTSYTMRGFTFDMPHVIGGLRKGALVRRIIDELGVNIDFVELEPYQKFIYPEHTIKVYTEIEKYKQELKRAFPQDSESIDRYFETLTKLNQEVDRMPQHLGVLDLLSFPARFPKVFKYRTKTFEDLLSDHIKNPKLRAVLGTSWGYVGSPPSRVSALYMAMQLMSYHTGGAWYPRGGYGQLADAFAKAFVKFGGELILATEVKKITIKNDKASGVELENGKFVESKLVVSNGDTKRTFLNLIERQNLKAEVAKRIEQAEPSATGLVVHLGVEMRLDDLDLNYGNIFSNEEYDNEESYRAAKKGEISYKNFGISVPSLHDPSLAPEGCHALDILLVPVPYLFKDKWLTENGRRTDAYRKLKEEIANRLIASAEKVIPNLSKNVLVKDISTPLTYERYTFASEGCWYDLAQTPSQSIMNRLANSQTIPNLHFTGSKSLGGGMYGSMMGGFLTASEILKS